MIGEEEAPGGIRPRRGLVARNRSRRLLRVEAGVLLAVLLALLVFGPGLIEETSKERIGERLAAPGGAHPWGTDDAGRDTFARVAVACGATGVAMLALWALAFAAGTAAGILRALVPGRPRRWIDAGYRSWDCFPKVLVAAALVILSGQAGPNVIAVLGVIGAVMVSRGVGDVLIAAKRHHSYRAAVAGCAPAKVLWKSYRLPHALRAGAHGAWTFLAPALIWETSLAFVSPAMAMSPWSLGSIMREGSPFLMDAPWLVFAPGGALCLLLLLVRFFETVSGARLARYLSLLDG